MAHVRLPCALALAAFAAVARPAEAPRPEGTIESQGAQVEVLSKRVAVGKRVELPEGWFRVEEEGIEDEEVGSFSIVSSSSEQAPAATPAAGSAEAPSPATAVASALTAPGADLACRRERSAYLRELWHESGIEVSDPDALIEGLEAGNSGPATGYYWFALATDTFRNLAWSSDLRGRAQDLVRCIRVARGDAP